MTWNETARGYLPSIPAKEWLAKSSLSSSNMSGVAAAAYRIKQGDSVWLQLPSSLPSTLVDVSHYFHQSRADALFGIERSTWFNQHHMISRSDLLVFCRSLFQNALFNKIPELGAHRFKTKDQDPKEKRIASTLLADHNKGLTAICDSLSVRCMPFLIIIDLTPFGHTNNPQEVIEHIESYFPVTPKLYLSFATDIPVNNVIDSTFKRLKSDIQRWRQAHDDIHQWISERKVTPSTVRLIEVPDVTIEKLLINALNLCKELKSSLANHELVIQQIMPIAYRIIKIIRGLSIPLAYHESYMNQHRRYGLYPSLPLTEWIERLSEVTMPFGTAESAKSHLVNNIKSILKLLMHPDARTGKAQALEHWLSQSTEPSCIITSSERDAEMLRNWILMSSSSQHHVIAAGSARQLFKLTSLSRAIILNPLWESEFYFLSLFPEVDWLSYPREVLWHDLELKSIFAKTTNDDAKFRWWNLEETGPLTLVNSAQLIPVLTYTQCTGSYPKYFNIEITSFDNPDLITQLMQLGTKDEFKAVESSSTSLVTVITEQGDYYKYHPNHKVYCLDQSDNVEVFHASELTPGMVILEAVDNNHGDDLFELLVEHVVSTTDYQYAIPIAKKWLAFVDAALIATSNDVSELHKNLLQQNISITKESVKHWTHHKILHPQNPERVMTALSLIADLRKTPQEILAISNAQRMSKELRIKIGKEFRKMIIGNYSDRVTINSDIRFDFTLLKDILILETIDSIIYKPAANPKQKKDSVVSIMQSAINENPTKLELTNPGLKSAAECNFSDLNRITVLMSLLSNQFYDVYLNKTLSLSAALAIAAEYDIGYAGATSEQTKGRFQSYRRVYNGKVISVDKHLKLGNSRDPKHCFRIYFHVDDELQKLVIHHAGRHLPT